MSIAAQVKAIVDGGEEADDILRASLAALHGAVGAAWSAIAFVEEGQMAIGPLIGESDGAPEPALAVPIVYRGDTVAALWFGGYAPARGRGRARQGGGAARSLLPGRLGHRRRGVGPLDVLTE